VTQILSKQDAGIEERSFRRADGFGMPLAAKMAALLGRRWA